MTSDPAPGLGGHDVEEVTLVARGIATAVAPETGVTDVQAQLLEAIASALTGFSLDYRSLDPLGPDELAGVLAGRDLGYRQRIVHHMVLGELVLRPIPTVVAHRVAVYAEALGVKDDFVRVARRYAQGAYGLAWMDLQRSGFVEHVRDAAEEESRAVPAPAPFEPAQLDPELAARWRAFEDLPAETLGRCVWEMYDGRGFELPGTSGGAPKYLAQHDFVHVLGEYGTNLKGELEVFAFIGRADPDPKGFAWLATLTGLFETGYITSTGFFDRDVRQPVMQAPGMQLRVADGIRRGKVVCERYGVDLFEVDFYGFADRPVDEVREVLGVPPKSSAAIERGFRRPLRPRRHVRDPTPGRCATSRREHVNQNFTQTITVRCADPAPLVALLAQWDVDQATSDIMGYMGTRLLADREHPGCYLIVADFGVVDPDVSAADEAVRNNARPETQAWAARLIEVIDGQPEYHHHDELYRTDR